MKDLNKIAKEIHEANKAKGFHEEEHSIEHMMCLVISELMEAVEADRKGNRVDYHHEEEGLAYTIMEDAEFKEWYECTTKGSVEEELADAVIRLLDTAGALGLSIEVVRTKSKDGLIGRLFTENIFGIIDAYIRVRLRPNVRISAMIFDIETLCEVMGIDLWKHVDMKLKYNKLRPYKHGKQY